MVTSKYKGRPKRANYPYASARIKARKSTLIPKAQYEKFMVMEVPAIIRYISETAYGKEISDLNTTYSGIDLLEAATYANLANNYREVLNFCRGNLKIFVAKLLTIWDNWNIKTILRGKSYGASKEDIMEDIVSAGSLSFSDLKEMASIDDIDTIIDMLKGTKYYKFIQEARLSDGSIDQLKLENEMDKDYYISLLDIKPDSNWLARIVENFFREQIDVMNIKTLFKLKFQELDCDHILNYIIPGGYELKENTLKRLALIEDFDQFVNELKAFKFWPYIEKAANTLTTNATLNPVMNSLDDYNYRMVTKFGKLYPLSVLPFLDYFMLKKIEVDNIRIICRGKEAGLSPDLIRSMLILI